MSFIGRLGDWRKTLSPETTADRISAISAGISAIGAVVAAVTLLFVWDQIKSAESQWKTEQALNLLSEHNYDIPYLPRYCVGAAATLSTEQLIAYRYRRSMEVDEGVKDQKEMLRMCFADLVESQQRELFTDLNQKNTLTSAGTSKLAQRVNFALNNDDLVAQFITADIVDRLLLMHQYKERVCKIDKIFLENARNKGGIEFGDELSLYFSSIIQFLNSNEGDCNN